MATAHFLVQIGVQVKDVRGVVLYGENETPDKAVIFPGAVITCDGSAEGVRNLIAKGALKKLTAKAVEQLAPEPEPEPEPDENGGDDNAEVSDDE